MSSPLLYENGRPLSRNIVAARARRLADRLAATPDCPLVPLCSRRGDLIVTLLAAQQLGRSLMLPHDDRAAALSAITVGCGPVVLLRSVGDPPPQGFDWQFVVEHDDAAAGAAAQPDAPLPFNGDNTVVFYTSGTTGAPTPHCHRMATLLAGTTAWMRLVDVDGRQAAVLATVPGQHMFGFESSVMLPTYAPNIAVVDERPFFPQDIEAALWSMRGARVLITTPLHLKALAENGRSLPKVHRIICATAHLSPQLAQQVEEMWDVPVLDIYGSTETGMIAARRSAHGDVFRLRDDMKLDVAADPVRVYSGHFTDGVALHDRFEVTDNGFRLLGRGQDLIKVAGKRASLADLTNRLKQAPDVLDGVMMQTAEDGADAARMIAVVAAPNGSADRIRRYLRDHLPAVFTPRRIIFVDALPYNALGKLQAQRLMELVNTNTNTNTGADADPPPLFFTVPPDHPALAGHFPGNPIVPGVVTLDHVLELAGVNGRVVMQSVKFQSVLRAGERCDVTIDRKGERGTAVCRVGDRTVLTLRFTAPAS